jgi:tRNA threonylcarbamoyladenosine biosynthesis protein TsaE
MTISHSASAEETFQMGLQFGRRLQNSCIIALSGDLGAGKTTFIRGIVSSLEADEREVCSPTFTYLNIYQGRMPIYHFDLYRIPSAQEFEAAGFDEYLQADGICCIEWPDILSALLSEKRKIPVYRISIAHKEEGLREIKIA